MLDMVMPGPGNSARSLHMHYVMSPIETVNKINELLVNYKTSELIMDDILRETGLSGRNLDEPEFRNRIGEYLVEHEESMKNIFMRGNSDEKEEIRQIYRKYIPHHKGF